MTAYVHSDQCHSLIVCTIRILNQCTPIPLSTSRVYNILQKVLPCQDPDVNEVCTSQQNLVNFIKEHKHYFDYSVSSGSISLKTYDFWPSELDEEALNILVKKLKSVSCILLRNLHSHYDPQREEDIFKYLRVHGSQAIESKFLSLIVKHQDSIILCGDRVVISNFKTDAEDATEILINQTGIISYTATNWGLINPWQKAVPGKIYLNKKVIGDSDEAIKDLFPMDTVVNFDAVASTSMKYTWQATYVSKKNEAPLNFDLPLQSCLDVSESNNELEPSTESLEEGVMVEKEDAGNKEITEENSIIDTAVTDGEKDLSWTTNMDGEAETSVCPSESSSVESDEGHLTEPSITSLLDSNFKNITESNCVTESSITPAIGLEFIGLTESNQTEDTEHDATVGCLNPTDEQADISDTFPDSYAKDTELFTSKEEKSHSILTQCSNKEKEPSSSGKTLEETPEQERSEQVLSFSSLNEGKYSTESEATDHNIPEECTYSYQLDIPDVQWKLQAIAPSGFYILCLIQLVYLLYNKVNIDLISEGKYTTQWFERILMKLKSYVIVEEFLWSVRILYYRHVWIQSIIEITTYVCSLLEQWSPYSYCTSPETSSTSNKQEIYEETIQNLAKIILEELELKERIKVNKGINLVNKDAEFGSLHSNVGLRPVFKNVTTQTTSTGSIVSTKCFKI